MFLIFFFLFLFLLEAEFVDDPLLTVMYLISPKEASGKSCKIWLKLRLLKDIETFQTRQTWIDHNATHYHKLNALPHVLPHALPHIFSEICLVLGYLQRIATRYRHFFKKISIYIFL